MRSSIKSKKSDNKSAIRDKIGGAKKPPAKPADPLPIGKEKNVTYKPKSKCLWPGDFGFVIFTSIIIIVPACLCLIVVIWMSDSEEVTIPLKLILTIVYIPFFYISLKMLYSAAFSDPGIIPNVHQNSNIPNTLKKVADSKREYFVEYKNK